VASTKQILGLGLAGVLAYLLMKRSQAGAAPTTVAGSIAGGSVAATGALVAAPIQPNALPGQITAIGGTVAQATALIPGVGVPISAGISVATGIAATIAGIFGGHDVPPDPVARLLIQEQPYNYLGSSNFIEGAKVYAYDEYGYLHEVMATSLAAAGYQNREVIAVDWKVFSMLQLGGTPISDARQLDQIAMPRPASPDLIRAVLGNDALFQIGQSLVIYGPHGPGNVAVAPITGTPAWWSAQAGSYVPTQVVSPGEYA
jgi:hypothetical protein